MRIHYFQHEPFEDLGSMAAVFKERGYSLTATHWYKGDAGPGALNSFDALIIMGGAMSVHDESTLPWLIAEKKLIKQAITAGKTVLGICLGAQLIADVLGAEVRRNSHKEIGWHPLTINPNAATHAIASVLAKYPEVFHWHGETFAIPEGALHLASSAACANQAYVYQDRVIGLQFHLETTFESATALTEECPGDMDGTQYAQNAQQILASKEKFEKINQAMKEIIDVVF
jgi:GMP synthase-like glutamine amidotransferase